MSTSKKHQADHVLRAFRYQLLQSLDAWMSLRPGEVLWLETEEDFSVLAGRQTTDVQVKSSVAAAGPTAHSLHSESVQAVLRRYWERSDHGRDPRPLLAFIANGGAARERGLTFPADMPGLVYWRAAALDADTTPIRRALRSIFANEPIGEWINQNPTDDELRGFLLRRVTWMLNQADVGPLTELIRERVATLYLAKGIFVSAADEGLSMLLDLVFQTACHRDQQERRLTAVDLHRSIEGIALQMAAVQNVGRATAQLSNNEGVNVARLGPLSANIVVRPTTVSQILDNARGESVIWLHGAHGVGKSTLAQLIAAQAGGIWLVLDLRPLQQQNQSSAARVAFRELMQAILSTAQLGGVIIDDLSEPVLSALRRLLGALATSLASRGIRVLVTSSYAPSPARLAELGASAKATVQAPYFSEDEVRSLVTAREAPSANLLDAWVRFIFLTTYGGHPLLVAAKVASLRARAWPNIALIEDVGPLVSDAVRATREEARRRLLDEIPSPDGRELLRRLSCVFDRTDDTLILNLARLNPPIPHAGDLLAILRGSWIEIMPNSDLRLSPLIVDIGSDVGLPQALEYKRAAAEHWLSMRRLDERTLPLCFWNAFLGKHTTILFKLCEVIQSLRRDQLRGAATLLSPLVFLPTETPLYKEVPPVGTMLRLLQFEVANAVEDADAAGKVAERLFEEINDLEHEELRLLQVAIAVPKVLFAESSGLSPCFQLNCALRLRTVMHRISELVIPGLAAATIGITRGLPAGVDLSGFLFAAVVTRIRNSERMLAMIEALDQLTPPDRNSLIDQAATTLALGPGSFVHNGWASEQLEDHNLRPVLERFTRMATIVGQWGRSDIQDEITCACSVILDEGLGDRAAAIAVVDDAVARSGTTPALVRQKAKVLGHSNDHRAAALLLMSVEDTVGRDVLFDRALALRDGGVSAARADLFDDAVRLFRKAYEALSEDGSHDALAAGMKIETAIVLWTSNQRPSAIQDLANALDLVEQLVPAASRQNERLHQLARLTVGLFWNDLDRYSLRPKPIEILGRASALAGDDPVLGLNLAPLPDVWRMLALCEIELGLDTGIEDRSEQRQATHFRFPAVEIFIAKARYARALLNDDLECAFRLGIKALSIRKVATELRASGEARASIDKSEQKTFEMLRAEGWGDLVDGIILDAIVWRKFGIGVDADSLEPIRTACKAVWGPDASADLMLAAALGEGTIATIRSVSMALAAKIAPRFNIKGNPRARIERDLLLVSHAAHSTARTILEPHVVDEVANGWSAVLADETFALHSPLLYAGEIEAAIADTKSSGLRGAARLILAAAPAVRFSPGEAWTKFLQTVSQETKSIDQSPVAAVPPAEPTSL